MQHCSGCQVSVRGDNLLVLVTMLSALRRVGVALTARAGVASARSWHGCPPPARPPVGDGRSYRRIVHYEDSYTVRPLSVTNLAGRDPKTGRVAVSGIGGGIKHKFHWIKWLREGPTEGPPKEEKVLEIMFDGCRTAHIALVASGDEIKYYIATENMKAGDIIRTSRCIPRIPVLPKEGDAHPLGALPIGTIVSSIEKFPGKGCTYIQSAGTFGKILRRDDSRIIVSMPSKREFSFDEHCLAVVGRVSNAIHNKTPIGSASNLRLLGYRPRSGLWQRKSGRHGRKIKPPKPVKKILPVAKKPQKTQLTMTV